MAYISEKIIKLGIEGFRARNVFMAPCVISFVLIFGVFYSHYSLKFVNIYFDFVVKCLECE